MKERATGERWRGKREDVEWKGRKRRNDGWGKERQIQTERQRKRFLLKEACKS